MILDDLKRFEWLKPWHRLELDPPGQLEAELKREVGRDHRLSGKAVCPVGRRFDVDDVLFYLPDGSGELVVVHLTWSRSRERDPQLPWTRQFSSAPEWILGCMLPDHLAFPELPAEDQEAIQDIHHRWISKELAGEPRAVLDLCTDDVVWMPPDSPPLSGSRAILRWLGETTTTILTLKITNLRIGGCRTVAYKAADYAATYRIEGEADTKEQQGTHLWMLRPTTIAPANSSGRELTKANWKVSIVAWTCA